jgi:CHASE3 domain sensor protein
MSKDDNNFSQVAGLVTSLHSDFNSLAKSNTKILEKIATLDERTVDMKEDIEVLCRIVRDGNGSPPMSQRLAQVEEVVKAQGSDIAEIHQSCNSIVAAKTLTRSQVIAGAVVMLVTVLLSVIGLAVAVASK